MEPGSNPQTPDGGRMRGDRIAGAVLGGAIGDALGAPVEFDSLAAIRSRFGPAGIRDLQLVGGVALYTDDTQLAEVVLRAALASARAGEELDPAMRRLAREFVRWAEHPLGGHRAPGNACLAGCRALQAGASWSEAGGAGAGGCGSVMRAWPLGLVFAHDLARAEEWAVAQSMPTHRAPLALAACAAVARGTALLLHGATVEGSVADMISTARRYDSATGEMLARAAREATDGAPADAVFDRLRGWAAHEALAAAIFVLVRHADDFEAAVVEGANTPGDSDSIASIAGALVGARVGLAGLPARWVEQVERGQELLALARECADFSLRP